MNDDAKLYHKSNVAQIRDAIICLEEYIPRMSWDDSEDDGIIIDIGCGDGCVTNLIKNFIPKNFKTLIGCDMNETMVKFANDHYKSEDLYFTVLDIEGPIPEDLRGKFNHLFSMYTMHWVKNQEKAFTNIFNLLSKGGDCLLSFLGYMPIYTAYWAVASTDKWKKWIPSCESFMSPYHNLQEPDKHITNMLKKIGFQTIEVNCKHLKFNYSIDGLKNTIRSINPFSLPKDVFEEFLNDFVVAMYEMGLVNNGNNEINIKNFDSMTVPLPYNLIVVYAKIP